ncbi:MAG: PspA/IM30 family protein [Pseudomonadota bacterium]
MSVIAKILTLLRGSARELGESVIDANATTIYEQEIVEARNAIMQAKGELTGVMAKEMQSARELERLKSEIGRLEGLALEALDKGKEDLAQEVAVKVAETEAEFEEQTRAHANYALQIGNLKNLIKSAEGKVREHEREVAMARTTESVYKATRSISDNIGASGSKLVNARESLERIKSRHQEFADRMVAAEALEKETGTKVLEMKLAKAGIGADSGRAQRVMDRLRAQRERPQGEA